MNRNLITIALFAAISTSALATKPKPTPAPADGNATAVSAAQANAIAAAVALAVQKQMQAQAQLQSQNAQAISGGNSMSTTVQAQERDPVATAVAPSMNPTTQCALPIVGGFAVANLSMSGGSAYEGAHCQKIEESKLAAALGDRDTAAEIACELEHYRAARSRVGRPCASDREGGKPATKTADASPGGYSGTDPYVLARMRK